MKRAAASLALLLAACTNGVSALAPPSQAFRERPPIVTAGARLRVPVVTQSQLENGLLVFSVESPATDTLQLAFADRAALDDAASAGLAAITAFALKSGTVGASGSIVRHPELLGETVDFVLSGSGTVFFLTALGSEAPVAFETLARVVQHPALDSEALRLARNAAKTRNLVEANDVVHGLTRLGAREFFGTASPFGRYLFGSEPERAKISDEAVRAFYATRYQPTDSALLVVGPLEPARAVALAREKFEAWRPNPNLGAPHDLEITPIRPDLRTRGVGVLGGDASAQLVMTLPCPRRDSADTVAADLTAIILGELSSYGLRADLRHEAGSTYGVHARCVQDRTGGLMHISLDTEPKQIATALEAITSQLRRLRASPPAPTEVEAARALYLGQNALRLATNAGLQGMLVDQFMCALPNDYTARLEATVNATTPADIQRYAQHYLDPDEMVVAVDGSKRVLDNALSGLGRTRWLSIAEAQHGD